MPDALPITTAHALCVYAEPIIAGRRVVVIGDASLGLGARLADLGARIVHVYDPNAERVQWATRTPQRGVTVRDLPQGEFDVRDGAFDVALVPDVGSFANPQALVARLRRLVGSDGVLITAARNSQVAGAPGTTTVGGALDYYELYDLVSMQFEAVRMVGQVPFVGVTLAELGETDEAPQVSVDTQLVVASDPPEVYIAVGCAARVVAATTAHLEAYAIVQLPAEALASMPSLAPVQTARIDTSAELDAHKTALAAALLRTELLVAELEDVRGQLARASSSSSSSSSESASAPVDDERVRALEVRAGDSHVRAERLAHEVARLEEELERQRERGFRLVRDIEDEKKARQKAELELGIVRQSPDVVAIRERIVALEDALRAADAANRELALQNATLAEDALSGTVHMRGELQQELARVTELHEEDLARLQAALADRIETTRLLEAELARAIDAHPAEIERFEAALRERGQAIALLEQELLRREALVRELLAEVEEARELAAGAVPAAEAAPSDALVAELEAARNAAETRAQEASELRARLDALALETARREAELQTNAWRIAELDQRAAMLEARANEAVPRAELDALAQKLALADAERVQRDDELAALRQALAQEHADRARLESGDALARARAEIERQAVLLEQLSRELDMRDRASLAAAAAQDGAPAPAET